MGRRHRRITRPARRALLVVASGALGVLLVGVATLAAANQGPFAAPPRDAPYERALLVGDSLLFDARASIDRTLSDSGVEARWVGGPGEGPLTRQAAWVRQVAAIVELFDPDVVVIEACCNYAQHDDDERYVLADGRPVERDTEEMHLLWAMAASSLVEAAGSGGADVYVVVAPPPVPGSYFDLLIGDRIARFEAAWRSIAATHPSVEATLVETAPSFSVAGEPVAMLGEVGRVRHPDGLHFVGPGIEVFAEIVTDAVVG